MNRVVFFDVDGTILDSGNGKKEMTPAVQKAIRDLQADGDYVFIATGRPYAFISDHLKQFGFDGFLLSNGAQIILKDQTIYKDPMDKDFIRSFAEEMDQHDMQYILEGEYHSYMKKDNQKFYDFLTELGIKHDMIQNEYRVDDLDVYKIEVLCNGSEKGEICRRFLEPYGEEYEYFFSISKVLFEVHSKRNTKATGIERVVKILDIPPENSFAFGDGTNDIQMLEAAGMGIAMGNASDSVKAYANVVTGAVDQDGVASGIYKYILNKQ